MGILKVDASIQPFLGIDPFETITTLKGETVRDKEGRRTFKVRLGNKNYFIKYHRGIGWKEIAKDLAQLRFPIISAYNEYLAITKLQQLGVSTTNPVAIGVRGINPARTESFLVTEAIENAVTLEDLTKVWPNESPNLKFKRALIEEVATIARMLHDHGMNHRDFYLCHFRIDSKTASNQDSKNISLSLMDLHRAQIREKVPSRWLIKDLGALLFSAAHIGLSRTDIFRFIAHYRQGSPSKELRKNERFWNAVYQRANKFHLRDWKQPMPLLIQRTKQG